MEDRLGKAIEAARLLEDFCSAELIIGAQAKDHVMERPARLVDELRFFLDVHCPTWRKR